MNDLTPLLDLRRKILRDREVLDRHATTADPPYGDAIASLQDINKDFLSLLDDTLVAYGKEPPIGEPTR